MQNTVAFLFHRLFSGCLSMQISPFITLKNHPHSLGMRVMCYENLPCGLAHIVFCTYSAFNVGFDNMPSSNPSLNLPVSWLGGTRRAWMGWGHTLLWLRTKLLLIGRAGLRQAAEGYKSLFCRTGLNGPGGFSKYKMIPFILQHTGKNMYYAFKQDASCFLL